MELDASRPAGDDALDSFMTTMQTQDAESNVNKIAFSLRLTEEQLQQTKQLLDIADPSQEHRKRFLEDSGTET